MIIFQNPGLIDPVLIEVFGASAKKTATPIGQFGTGLKYAIAVILRTGDSISIFRGAEYLPYTSKMECVRDKEFNFVYRDTNRMPFTTELGKNWEPWQAFRELWANCIDEGGMVWWQDDDDNMVQPFNDHTTVIWTGPGAKAVWDSRSTILLETQPIYQLDGLNLHEGQSEFIYYQGVRVYKMPHRSKFTINLTRWQWLTEERLLASWHSVPAQVAEAILKSDDEQLIQQVLTIHSGFIEGSLPWKEMSDHEPSETFIRTSMALHNQEKLQGSAKDDLFTTYVERYSSYGYADPKVRTLSAVENAVIGEAVKLWHDTMAQSASDSYHMGAAEDFSVGAYDMDDESKWFSINQWHKAIYVNSNLLPLGAEVVARALIVASATLEGGNTYLQLANFILHRAFDPELKARKGNNDD